MATVRRIDKVSFAEYRLFYRALLQKRNVILSILLTETIPYKIETNQIVQKKVRKTDQFVKKMSLLNFRKKYGMIQAKKMDKEAVGSLRSLAIATYHPSTT